MCLHDRHPPCPMRLLCHYPQELRGVLGRARMRLPVIFGGRRGNSGPPRRPALVQRLRAAEVAVIYTTARPGDQPPATQRLRSAQAHLGRRGRNSPIDFALTVAPIMPATRWGEEDGRAQSRLAIAGNAGRLPRNRRAVRPPRRRQLLTPVYQRLLILTPPNRAWISCDVPTWS